MKKSWLCLLFCKLSLDNQSNFREILSEKNVKNWRQKGIVIQAMHQYKRNIKKWLIYQTNDLQRFFGKLYCLREHLTTTFARFVNVYIKRKKKYFIWINALLLFLSLKNTLSLVLVRLSTWTRPSAMEVSP